MISVFALRHGITLLLINLDNTTTFEVKVSFNSTRTLQRKHKSQSQNKDYSATSTEEEKRNYERGIPSDGKGCEFTQPDYVAQW